ncbi:hypothetical protein GQ42DRAFT_163228 [Ramicandelaber brevisporus]|nr:hypothetical protein GQ42DRAFT_163228 [Ramicandelaber brevisporus]
MDDWRKYQQQQQQQQPQPPAQSYGANRFGGGALPPGATSTGTGGSWQQPAWQPGQQYANEDEEYDAIRSDIMNIKQESLASTRRARQVLDETQATAQSTLTTLGTQSEQLIRTERQLEVAQLHSESAKHQAEELKRANRSIFNLSFSNPFNKKKQKQREQELARLRQEEAAQKAEQLTKEQAESNARVASALAATGGGRPGQHGQQVPPGGLPNGLGTTTGRYQMQQPQGHAYSAEDRSRYMLEDEDAAVEDEIDDNLNYMSSAIGNLNRMANAMQTEVKDHNQRITRITDRARETDVHLGLSTRKIGGIS